MTPDQLKQAEAIFAQFRQCPEPPTEFGQHDGCTCPGLMEQAGKLGAALLEALAEQKRKLKGASFDKQLTLGTKKC